MIEKIVSGGQTGVDMAALKAAVEAGIPHGGWCPQGRIQEKGGTIPTEYKLTEVSGRFDSEKDNYDARTKKNIEDSDGTLILVPNDPLPPEIQDGTLLTIAEAKRQKKPHLTVNLSQASLQNITIISNWLIKEKIKILNIAGPRETSSPGIHLQATRFLKELFVYLKYYLGDSEEDQMSVSMPRAKL